MTSLFFAFLLSVGALAGPVQQGPSLIDLVIASPNVVRGTVVKSVSWRDGEEYKTKYTFAVYHQIRGQGPEVLSATLPGGTIRGRTQHVQGYPVWHEGDMVVLFLDPDLQIDTGGMFTVEGNILLDPYEGRTGAFPALYTELTHDLGRLTTFSPLPRERVLRGQRAPSMVP